MGVRKNFKMMHVVTFFAGIFLVLGTVMVMLFVNRSMHQEALREAEAQALLLLDRNLATHMYFSQVLKPKLFAWTAPLRSQDYFEPSWMSSIYVNREIQKYFQSIHPTGYYIKDAAINARNPENEADAYEKDFFEKLKTNKNLASQSAVRVIKGEPYLVVLRRGEVIEGACLKCHSEPGKAPSEMLRQYGGERAFHRKTGDFANVISVRIPLADAYAWLSNTSRQLYLILGTGLFIFLGAQLLLYRRFFIAPIGAIRDKALELAGSEDKLGATIPRPGTRELNELCDAFNEMSEKLRIARDQLEERVQQRTNELMITNEQLSREIVERGKAEEQLQRRSKLLAAINSIFFEILQTRSKQMVAKTCLAVAQELTGSEFSFIGEVTPEHLFTITAVSDPGWEACRISEAQADALIRNMDIRGIWGQVILKEQPLVVNNPLGHPDRVGVPEGHPPLTSFLGVPLKDHGKVIGMIALANNVAGYTEENMQDMEALSVAFVEAIRRKQAEEKLQQTLDSLRKAVSTTVQVLAAAVEAKDPYTAGHQSRSADLARAIAKEMGFPQERVECIRIAGFVHDVGKLSVPAEILSKPTKLSAIEFSLIKEHARQGYEILKKVESPWPLAEIVYQHHERMDGSGYPRKLRGEEICMEARILAVSDVVESMASNRPYRPSLGIDLALEEIETHSSTFYDKAVVEACLRLFREKGFQLK